MTTNLAKSNRLRKMRNEEEMLTLILSTAQADERIRAVILNGSRANPNTVRDRFQDFDIVYVVTDLAPFVDDPHWIDRFGERMILQTPTMMGHPPPDPDEHFTYLMIFTDGNRIDLTLVPIEQIFEAANDSLSILLLDKDHRLGPLPPPSEANDFPKPPTDKAFQDCCNEFWWVSPYVAKSLARDEILYAHFLLEHTLRPQLMRMLTWLFGVKTDFKRNPGISRKHIKEVLPPETWSMLLATYAPAEVEAIWEALFIIGALFRACACEIADVCVFDYPHTDDALVNDYLSFIRTSI